MSNLKTTCASTNFAFVDLAGMREASSGAKKKPGFHPWKMKNNTFIPVDQQIQLLSCSLFLNRKVESFKRLLRSSEKSATIIISYRDSVHGWSTLAGP